ncbi:MAG: UMP kinase [Cytophagales bacterium]|nr:UMP kinase [Cytophagales bacterium]
MSPNEKWKAARKQINRGELEVRYKRILLKLSGEALGTTKESIDLHHLQHYAQEIQKAHETGIEIAVVIGGGNIFRGTMSSSLNIDRVQGDHMGMLATIINAMALQSALENLNVYTRIMSGIRIDQVCEPFIRRRAIRHIEKGRVIIFSAGLGSPYFTTDSTASLRAVEIEAEVVLKGTQVDGIYSEDPMQNPKATRYEKISFQDAYKKNLQIMDKTAFTLCHENHLPIVVFDLKKSNNILNITKGHTVGTLVS